MLAKECQFGVAATDHGAGTALGGSKQVRYPQRHFWRVGQGLLARAPSYEARKACISAVRG